MVHSLIRLSYRILAVGMLRTTLSNDDVLRGFAWQSCHVLVMRTGTLPACLSFAHQPMSGQISMAPVLSVHTFQTKVGRNV